ncbi:MAG: hypothetical protein HQL14_06545 [Candidatus Omnitrophica bacterium]|nr:hypothetical protein [Candidatus Omnitrophota bacterium]
MLITLCNRAFKILLLSACLVLLAVHLSVPINLTAVDIGRHIKNGELILNGYQDVLYKNFYSFTYPEYPFINHHWLFGVIAYMAHRISGFVGLSVFYILLLVGAFLLAFDSARRFSGFYFSLFLSTASFLFLICRPEIRPEGFSVFFLALDFWLLQCFLERRAGSRVLFWIIPLVQVLWVNIHIFFFMGPLLVGIFLWQAGLKKEDKQCKAILGLLLWVVLFINLINPSGFEGMLTPLNGFKKFGYDLAENQTVLFMIKRFPNNIVYKYYLLVAFFMMAGIIIALWQRRFKAMPWAVLGAFTTIASFKAVRLIMPFGFLFIPLASYFWAPYIKKSVISFICAITTIAGIISCVVFMPWRPQIGLMPGVNVSAEFFKQSGLKGPVFSNYDIGGYLIYHLALKEKVFVDNRQEAFPYDFFRKVYIPMQEDPAVWKGAQNKYGFNVIYFYRHDITPWGQAFLIDRISDTQWAPVFADDYTVIFARRGSVDQGIIDRFELPMSMFRVVKNNAS